MGFWNIKVQIHDHVESLSLDDSHQTLHSCLEKIKGTFVGMWLKKCSSIFRVNSFKRKAFTNVPCFDAAAHTIRIGQTEQKQKVVIHVLVCG